MIDSGDILSLLGIQREKVSFIDAVPEANNDNIQTLVDVCYGLNNFKRSRNRILYINRNKKDI